MASIPGYKNEKIFVRDALQSCASGKDQSLYLKLLEELRECDDTTKLVSLLNAMAEWASLIGDHHDRFKEMLVMLFSFDWDIADEQVMGAFENVLVSLVSANGGFLDEAFRLLIKNFTREDEEETADDASEANDNLKKIRLRHLHQTIQRILRLCPLGCSTLLNVIIESFPKQQQDVRIQCDFAKEALKIGEHVPVLQDRVVRMAIKSLLELDLELATAVQDARQAGMMFRMEDMVTEDDDTSNKRLRVTESDLEVAEKVDSLLCILFEFIEDHMSKKKSTQLLFKAALDSFEKDVLRTGRAKFTQFFVFYLCSAKSSYVDAFISLLLERIFDEKENLGVRENASKFLGSFLARAKYVHAKQIKLSIERLNDWLQGQIGSISTKHRKRRALFVSTFQSIIYVVLFKGAQIGGVDFLNSLNGWREMCEQSSFRPLSRISSDILEEYATVIGQPHLVRPSMIGSMNHAISSDMQVEENNGNGQEPEEGKPAMAILVEFPFDPVGLERSAKKLEGHYQEWYASEPAEDDDEEEEEEESDEEDEEEIALNYDLLNVELPKPIRIERIRRMLGGAWAKGGENQIFPSPGLRPSPSPPMGGSLYLSQASSGAIAIPKAGHLPARQRSISTMSTESGLAGSW